MGSRLADVHLHEQGVIQMNQAMVDLLFWCLLGGAGLGVVAALTTSGRG